MAVGIAQKGSVSEPSQLDVPFMQIFMRRESGPAVTTAPVQVSTEGVSTGGFLARASVNGKLPGILLIPDEQGITEPIRQVAHEIAGTGYVVLAVDYDPEHVAAASSLVQAVAQDELGARLDAAVAWLAAQPFVDAGRIGALGWAQGGAWVLRLAERGKLQAGVVAGAVVCSEPDLLLRVHATPVFVLAGGDQSGCAPRQIAVLQQRVAAAKLPHVVVAFESPGEPLAPTSGSENSAAERAWVAAYEFLAKHVEDARQSSTESASQPQAGIARVVDIMRAINSDDGVRGQLARSLASPPATAQQWEQARSRAAVLAEAGNMLLARRPAKGSLAGWRQRANDFREAAEVLLHAIEQHDFPATQDALRKLPQSCAACHADYR